MQALIDRGAGRGVRVGTARGAALLEEGSTARPHVDLVELHPPDCCDKTACVQKGDTPGPAFIDGCAARNVNTEVSAIRRA
jgi:hypothetical protein